VAVEAVENCLNVADFRRLFKRFTEAAAVQHTHSPFMVHITKMHRDSNDRDVTQSQGDPTGMKAYVLRVLRL